MYEYNAISSWRVQYDIYGFHIAHVGNACAVWIGPVGLNNRPRGRNTWSANMMKRRTKYSVSDMYVQNQLARGELCWRAYYLIIELFSPKSYLFLMKNECHIRSAYICS